MSDPIAALVAKWHEAAVVLRAKAALHRGHVIGHILIERATVLDMQADELEAALRADADAGRVPGMTVSHCESARASENAEETSRTHGPFCATNCPCGLGNGPADADARPPQESLAEAIMKVRERGTSRTYFAKRYDTDDEHVLMIYGFGDTFDLRVPKAAVPRRAEPPPSNAHHSGAPLTVSVNDGELQIVIGVDTLAHAVSYSDWANPYDDETGDYIRTFAITDAGQFASDVQHAILSEREDGSSLLSDFLDKMTEAAVDDGSEAVEYDQRIKHGETASIETWAGRAEPLKEIQS